MFQTFLFILEIIMLLFVLYTALDIMATATQTLEKTMFSILQNKAQAVDIFQFPFLEETLS